LSRIVGHLDLDYFYAQVEEVEAPSLKDTPIVVCVFSGRTENSGVVSTSNYKAREYGVKSGMPIALAERRLDGVQAAFIRMDRGKYETYSDRVMETLRGQVDVIEQAGIDEAFFDITKRTGGDYGAARTFAIELKGKILEEEKLTCSVGIGPNKVMAKIASDFKKPDGLTVVTEKETLAFLSLLPTSSGVDEEPVVDRGGVSQLSRIITLKKDTHDPNQVVTELLPALRDVHEKLVSRGLFFRNLSAMGILKNLSLHTKSKTLETPTDDYTVLEREVRELFFVLLQEVGDLRRAGVRMSELQDMVDQHSLTEFTS
jgi:DNA polymerase IV (DinB-like DNA polymerase)